MINGAAPNELKVRARKWTASGGWGCLLALVIFEFLLALAIRVTEVNRSSANWVKVHGYAIQMYTMVLRASVWLVLAYVFSRAPSPRSFISSAGLSRYPTMLGWCGTWLAVGTGLIGLYGTHRGWTAPNRVVHSFYSRGGEPLLFFVLFVTSVGPFFEEVVIRGYLYAAFRGTYGRVLSTFVTISVSTYFHWSSIARSPCTAACLILLWVLLCLLRERTGTIWNCVMAHAAYNAAQTVTWPTYVGPMILLLPFYLYSSRKTARAKSGQSQPNCEGEDGASPKQIGEGASAPKHIAARL